MKKMILALVVLFAMGNVAMAQEEQQKCGKKCDKTEMIKKRTEKMVKQYNLTDQQAAKLLKLNEDYAEKMPAMRPMGVPKGHFGAGAQMKKDPSKQEGCNSADKECMMKNREEMMKNRKAYNEELKEILGAEKFAQYQTDMKSRMQKGLQRVQGQKDGCCGKCSKDKQAENK